MSLLPQRVKKGASLASLLPGRAAGCVCALTVALAGCGLFGSKNSSDPGGYQAEASHQGPLEAPPDLSPLSKDDRFALPDQGTSAKDRKSTRLNSSHLVISYAVFCLKKKTTSASPRCVVPLRCFDLFFFFF